MVATTFDMDPDGEWWELEWARFAASPEFRAWEREVVRVGACKNPVILKGRTELRDPATGVVVRVFDAASRPGGVLILPCGNRRASRCEPFSRVYQNDSFQLVRAGLAGGKGVPASVGSHPRAFVTLTAPSFGLVHRRVVSSGGQVMPCSPHRSATVCEHGVLGSCLARHAEGDPLIGTPLCAGCYDYEGAVLWNARCSKLFNLLINDVRRSSMPKLAGMTAEAFVAVVKVSFVKVAEFQARGQVHFHAVVRVDGKQGPGGAPPEWAGLEMLEAAFRASARKVKILTPDGSAGVRELVWGDELDFVAVPPGDTRVAGYIAKYATKGAECAGTVDYPLTCRECEGSGLVGACPKCHGSGLRAPLEELPVTDHARALIAAAFRLGGEREYQGLRLRPWAHQLGYGGHFSTKSRRYSVTMGKLRQDRIDYQVAKRQAAGEAPLPEGVEKVAEWEYAGSGWSGWQVQAVEEIREDLERNRELARDARNGLRGEQERLW